MYQKTCSICGKTFECVNSRYHLCSDECRLKRRKINSVKKYAEFKEKIKNDPIFHENYKQICRINAIKRRKPRTCEYCGKRVKIMKNRFHESCIVMDALKDMAEGNLLTKMQRNRLYYRGYSQADLDEMFPDYLHGNMKDYVFAD